jgi:DNA-binding NtrC family response regulator
MKEKDTLVTEPLASDRTHRSTIVGRALILTADPAAVAGLPGLVQQSGLQPISMGTMAHLRSYRLNATISLMLCEERLPDGTFRDALDFFRRIAQRVPMIVFSRLAEWKDYLEALRCGAYDCLRYPFRTGELRWIIGRLLEQRCVPLLGSSGKSGSQVLLGAAQRRANLSRTSRRSPCRT